MGVPQNYAVVMDDHDLVLRAVTWSVYFVVFVGSLHIEHYRMEVLNITGMGSIRLVICNGCSCWLIGVRNSSARTSGILTIVKPLLVGLWFDYIVDLTHDWEYLKHCKLTCLYWYQPWLPNHCFLYLTIAWSILGTIWEFCNIVGNTVG